MDNTPPKDNVQQLSNKIGLDITNVDLSSLSQKTELIKKELFTVKSFGELDGKLSEKELWLDVQDNKLVITDGYNSMKATDITKDFSKQTLQQYFGEDIHKYIDFRNAGIDYTQSQKQINRLFVGERIKELNSNRRELASNISTVKYEIAKLHTISKQSRDPERESYLHRLKNDYQTKHHNLSSEIAKFEKIQKSFGPEKGLQSKTIEIKIRAQGINQKYQSIKERYGFNKKSMEGMQAARNIIGFQKTFQNNIQTNSDLLPKKIKNLSKSNPATAIAYKAYQNLSKMVNDPDIHR